MAARYARRVLLDSPSAISSCAASSAISDSWLGSRSTWSVSSGARAWDTLDARATLDGGHFSADFIVELQRHELYEGHDKARAKPDVCYLSHVQCKMSNAYHT